jgi:signal peptidase
MEPVIGQGDGYVVVPAGEIHPGDVIVYESTAREEYVTHRVVDVTDEGYVTKGDNNPSTDQAAGHPIVTDDDVVGSVLAIGDHPVSIPGFGWAVGVLAVYWPIGLLVLLLGGGLLERNPRSRDLVQLRHLTLPLVLTTVVGSAIVLAYSAPTYTMSLVAVASETADGRMIAVGEPAVRTIEIAARPAFTHQFIEATGVTVIDVHPRDGGATVNVVIPAKSAPGAYTATVWTYHYPAVLPYGVTSALHAIHPLAASLASITTIVAPLYALHWVLVDDRAPLTGRSRKRNSWWQFR